jgi:N-acetylneuraminic acid mutarotase
MPRPHVLPIALLLAAACGGEDPPTAPEAGAGSPSLETAGFAPDTWIGRASMPTGRSGTTGAVVNGVVYVMGGMLSSADAPPTAKLEAYWPNSSSLVVWWPKAPMPGARGYTNGAAVINGKIYVSGGYRADPDGNRIETNSLFRYDPVADTWSTRAGMPRPASGGATVAIDGKLYVYVAYGPDHSGGAALYRYDPSTDKWAARAAPPAVRTGAAVTVLGGKMWIMGGRYGKGSPENDVLVYDPVGNTWSTSKRPMFVARVGAAARTIDGKIYVAGGHVGSVDVTPATEEYDPALDEWIPRSDMLTARSFAASAVVGGRLYVIGGSGGGRKNEMYTP